ncbi:putative Epidermal patterning factor [Quillaja saponaria]|uniref:Epidermal patterning factor-like protein n=1 Tax=Quillaja saponaria TaxID=32244 RepID=A0AAD7QHM1_QUISA|nr:putative Epidermal patterning factor [Quillaja saponaria]
MHASPPTLTALKLDYLMSMRILMCIAPFLMALLTSTIIFARQIDDGHDSDQRELESTATRTRRLEFAAAAGSRLPDCSHACGSCSPCRLVMASLVCETHTETAETCPVSYRCMCNTKSYPVP